MKDLHTKIRILVKNKFRDIKLSFDRIDIFALAIIFYLLCLILFPILTQIYYYETHGIIQTTFSQDIFFSPTVLNRKIISAFVIVSLPVIVISFLAFFHSDFQVFSIGILIIVIGAVLGLSGYFFYGPHQFVALEIDDFEQGELTVNGEGKIEIKHDNAKTQEVSIISGSGEEILSKPFKGTELQQGIAIKLSKDTFSKKNEMRIMLELENGEEDVSVINARNENIVVERKLRTSLDSTLSN